MNSKEVLKLLKITRQTLTKYVKTGKISTKRNTNGFYDYLDSDVYALMNKNVERINIIYCRVSTSKQKKDLENQIDFISNYTKKNGIIVGDVYSEIGSGMSFERKYFQILLFKILEYKVDKIFISNKDRLCRLSFDLLKSLFSKFGCEIVVVNDIEKQENIEKEIFEDIISMLHCFAMRMYSGRRKKKLEIVSQDLSNDICS